MGLMKVKCTQLRCAPGSALTCATALPIVALPTTGPTPGRGHCASGEPVAVANRRYQRRRFEDFRIAHHHDVAALRNRRRCDVSEKRREAELTRCPCTPRCCPRGLSFHGPLDLGGHNPTTQCLMMLGKPRRHHQEKVTRLNRCMDGVHSGS